MLLKKILIALAATLIIVYFYPHPEANRYNYEEGRPWNYSKLIAPFDIPVHPDSATIIAARQSPKNSSSTNMEIANPCNREETTFMIFS